MRGKLYESMITSPEERALYNEWAQVWDEYRKGAAEVMALSRKAAGSYPREAHDLNTMTVNLIGIKADGILRKDIDLNNKGADTAARTRTTAIRPRWGRDRARPRSFGIAAAST
jgi:methyl-accepting chemotaxis protein